LDLGDEVAVVLLINIRHELVVVAVPQCLVEGMHIADEHISLPGLSCACRIVIIIEKESRL